jgi:hypothetical protein
MKGAGAARTRATDFAWPRRHNFWVSDGPLGRRRLLIVTLWPVAFVAVAATFCISLELARERLNLDSSFRSISQDQSGSVMVQRGLLRVVPLALVITFVMAPSTATRIFKSFSCAPFEYSSSETRRYLHDDFEISCSTEEHNTIRAIASLMVVLWPVGVPVLYGLLLLAGHRSMRSGMRTPLARATAFLSGGYDESGFWWEPLDMCRKLTLSTPAGIEPKS